MNEIVRTVEDYGCLIVVRRYKWMGRWIYFQTIEPKKLKK